MVNTIIDLIYEVRQKFEKIIGNTLDDWTEQYNENIMLEPIESWYHQDNNELVAELTMSVHNDDMHEYEDFDIYIALDDAGHVEVDITKNKSQTARNLPLDEEWLRQKLEYRLNRWIEQ